MASIDPQSGFCHVTSTFHSLRPSVPLPPPSLPLSFPSFAFSLLPSPLPNKPALISDVTADAISYPDLIAYVINLSSSLSSPPYSLSAGHVAFILSPPSIHLPVLYLSLLSLGSLPSPSNPHSSPSDLSHQLHITKPSLIFATTSTLPNLLPLNLNIPILLLDSPLFLSLLHNSFHLHLPADDIDQSAGAAILFSSGTTGNLKGVVLSHRNLIAGVGTLMGTLLPEAVQMVTVPLFHVFGFLVLMTALALGQTVVIQTERFEVGRLVSAVERFGVTRLAVAPPALLRLVRWLEERRGVGLGLGRLEGVACGGAPVGVGLVRRFGKVLPPNVRLTVGYGLTESTGGIFRAVGAEENRFGSAGRLCPGCEAMVVDPVTGRALHPCQQGEIWVKGPLIMKGYIGDEGATSATLNSEGWLKTGDLGYIDKAGFVFIVDRLKELIKYKGYQVPPAELENLLQTHWDVIEAAVIPYPDEEAGQVPMAFIVRQPNSTLHESEIMEFVGKQVAPYKKVRRVSFVNSIPKTPSGKILRKDLMQLATKGINPKL